MKKVFISFSKKRLVIPAFFYVFVLLGCDSESTDPAITFSGPTMGTTYNIKVIDEGQGYNAEQLQSWVNDELVKINQSMSTYISDSELSKFNQSPVDSEFPFSASLCFLFSVNHEVSEATGGRYDVTIGPLVNIWGFGPTERYGVPPENELAVAKSKVGYQALDFDCNKQRLAKTKAVYVDLSASAKGYATDELAKLLVSKGYRRTMVEIGGELHVLGTNASGKPWQIAVEKPTLGHSGGVQVLAVSDVAVATSGDYRNYYEIDGQRVSHTIDPITAEPITHKLASITVIAESGLLADAWATALNVLGPVKGFELAQEKQLAAYFIVRDGEGFEVKYTEAFKQYMVNL